MITCNLHSRETGDLIESKVIDSTVFAAASQNPFPASELLTGMVIGQDAVFVYRTKQEAHA